MKQRYFHYSSEGFPEFVGWGTAELAAIKADLLREEFPDLICVRVEEPPPGIEVIDLRQDLSEVASDIGLPGFDDESEYETD